MSTVNDPSVERVTGKNAYRQSQQQTASENTRREHDDLLLAMHKLEAALASPAPAREEKWAGRAGQELADVRSYLESHILSAEGPGGLFDEVLLSGAGAGPRVEALRREHSDLMELAKRLGGGLT